MSALKGLESDKPCSTIGCGHPYEAHLSMMHVSIPCIFSRCPCKKFTTAPPPVTVDADAMRRSQHATDCDALQRGQYEMNGFPPVLKVS